MGSRYEPESVGFSGGRIVGTSTGSQVRYHVTDYLGSVRVVADADGKRLEKYDYYPFGKRIEEAAQPISDNRYLFNGKEWQATGAVNLLDYGARMYDPNLGRWFCQDPEYQFLNSYPFCLNDPVCNIDPDGRILRIIFGNEFIDYIPGMVYTGTNSFARNIIKMLNTAYDNGGYKAIHELAYTKDYLYEINESAPSSGGAGAAFRPAGTIKGIILAGLIKTFSEQGFNALIHELFHALQHMNGQFGASVFNEVEAYVFAYGVSVNCYMGGSSSGLGYETTEGKLWEKAFTELVFREYSWTNMKTAVDNFIKGSYANNGGLYNNLPRFPKHPRTKQLQSMLQKYWTPLL